MPPARGTGRMSGSRALRCQGKLGGVASDSAERRLVGWWRPSSIEGGDYGEGYLVIRMKPPDFGEVRPSRTVVGHLHQLYTLNEVDPAVLTEVV